MEMLCLKEGRNINKILKIRRLKLMNSDQYHWQTLDMNYWLVSSEAVPYRKANRKK